jgi:hypothetical protein
MVTVGVDVEPGRNLVADWGDSGVFKTGNIDTEQATTLN